MLTNQEYRELDLSVLIDMLADQTVKYTRALVRGESGQTLDYYRSTINLLSTEIRFRKATGLSHAGIGITPVQQSSAT